MERRKREAMRKQNADLKKRQKGYEPTDVDDVILGSDQKNLFPKYPHLAATMAGRKAFSWMEEVSHNKHCSKDVKERETTTIDEIGRRKKQRASRMPVRRNLEEAKFSKFPN